MQPRERLGDATVGADVSAGGDANGWPLDDGDIHQMALDEE
jgi:hypothetical protein